MEIMKKMSEWLAAERRQRKEREEKARDWQLTNESKRVLQVREYDGELYLCYNNEPIMPTEGLKWDIATSLDVARMSYVEYRKDRLWNRM